MSKITIKLEKKQLDVDDIRRFVEFLDVIVKFASVNAVSFARERQFDQQDTEVSESTKEKFKVFLRESIRGEMNYLADKYIDSYFSSKTNNEFSHSLVTRKGMGEIFRTHGELSREHEILTTVSDVSLGSMEAELLIDVLDRVLAVLIPIAIGELIAWYRSRRRNRKQEEEKIEESPPDIEARLDES